MYLHWDEVRRFILHVFPLKNVFWRLLQKSLKLFSPSLLLTFISQDTFLSSVPVERNGVSVPAGDSSEISARFSLGHQMKGKLGILSISMFGILCILNRRVCLCDAL